MCSNKGFTFEDLFTDSVNKKHYENLLSNTNNLCKVVHFKKEKFDVYIGRPSKWGNPFTSKESELAEFNTVDRQESINLYKIWITKGKGVYLLDQLKELRGKTLGCWCSPKECHGDILSELVNQDYINELNKK